MPQVSAVIFSLNCFAASLLALFISFAADLQHPYWALLFVYLTSQPLTGALRSNAVLRVIGTIVGAAVAVALIPRLVNAPPLLSLAMAAWVAVCVYIAVLDRTPRALVFVQAGFGAAVVGFLSVNAPETVFDTAIDRVEEITIGICCATIVHTIFFPRDVGTVLVARMLDFVREAKRWTANALRQGEFAEEQRTRELVARTQELDTLTAQLPYDTSALASRTRAVRAAQDRLTMMLPLLVAAEDRIAELRAAAAMPVSLVGLMYDIADWLDNDGAPSHAADDLIARCLASIPSPSTGHGERPWPRLLTISALLRLAELVRALQDGRELTAFVRNPETGVPSHLVQLLGMRRRRLLAGDHILAAASALAAITATLGCCAFWIATAWPDGTLGAALAAAVSSLFATQDNPAAIVTAFLVRVVLAMPFAAFFTFALLPAVDGFAMLALILAPGYLLFGYWLADPVRGTFALPFILGTTLSLAIKETYTSDFAAFVNTYLAIIVGVTAALWALLLFRTAGVGPSVQSVFRRSWRDISRIASVPEPMGRAAWISIVLSRLKLLMRQAAPVGSDSRFQAGDLLGDMRVGLRIIELREIASAEATHDLDGLLSLLSQHYARKAQDRDPAPPSADILSAIDTALRAFLSGHEGPGRLRGLGELISLRRTLFPAAAAPSGLSS